MPHAVFLGASRGIGYHTALNLLSDKSTTWQVTTLLRKPEAFAADKHFAPFIENGRVKTIQGDGTNPADVQKLFDGGKVDVVVSSIGSMPKLTLRGIVLEQPSLCTNAALVLLNVMSKLPYPQPRLIAVSSMGMGDNHRHMPLALRILYPWLLDNPHKDKEGLEYLVLRASSAVPTPTSHVPKPEVLDPVRLASAPENFLPEFVIVRPAILMGSDEVRPEGQGGADKTRVGETISTYAVSRPEVARVIADQCIPGRNEWLNKRPVVGH